MRIALEVHRTRDLEARAIHRRSFLYRLLARVRFQQPTGWSEPQLVLVDTGAPYSLIPASLWPTLAVRRLREVPLRGLVPGEAARLDAILATVSAQLLDATQVSRRLTLWAILTHTDQVPLILGWAGCLDRATLVLDGRRNIAWLEF